jgi:hypothetical protein
MGDSHSFKPGSRPGTSPSPAKAADEKSAAQRDSLAGKPRAAQAGRVVHDERGNAIWDWVKDTARIAIDSTSRLLKKLEVPELKLEDTHKQLRTASGQDAGGGHDPYGRDQSAARFGNSRNTGGARNGSGPLKDAGGGYDPYGKGITRKR